jgi:hypothetical protein
MKPVKIETERLLLRPFRYADAPEFARLAGEWAVASMTSDIPYPFSAAQAMGWLRPVRGEVRFAIERERRLIGGAGYYRRRSGVAELGFWLGRPWWGQGYATEAARPSAPWLGNRRLPGFSSAASSTMPPRRVLPSSASRRWVAAPSPAPRAATTSKGHLLARPAASHAGSSADHRRGGAAAALAHLAQPARRPLRQ